MPMGLSHWAIYFKLVLTMLFWGGSFIAGHHLAQSMPHFSAATGRFVAALIPLFIFAYRKGNVLPRLTRMQSVATLCLGATGVFGYNIFFLAGLEQISASRAALIMATSPILTLLAVQCIQRTSWNCSQVLGVLFSTVGAVLVVTRGEFHSGMAQIFGAGELLILGAVIAWVIYTLIARYIVAGLDAVNTTIYATLWGTLMLAVPACFEIIEGRVMWPAASDWISMAYMGVCASALAFVWYTEGVAVIGAVRTAQFTNLVPVFGVLLAVLLLHESLSWASIAGGALVIGGVWFANKERPRQAVDPVL